MVLKYARWALERDEEMASHIFTERDDVTPLPPSEVLEFLIPFPLATVAYLEHVIKIQNSKVSLVYVKICSWVKDALALPLTSYFEQLSKDSHTTLDSISQVYMVQL